RSKSPWAWAPPSPSVPTRRATWGSLFQPKFARDLARLRRARTTPPTPRDLVVVGRAPYPARRDGPDVEVLRDGVAVRGAPVEVECEKRQEASSGSADRPPGRPYQRGGPPTPRHGW